MSIHYLETEIAALRTTARPNYGYTVYGYTVRSGAPTHILLRLKGEKRWRRLKVLCFSNAETLFLRIKKQNYFVSDYQLHGIPQE